MARITHYDIGDAWSPQATFTVNGTPTDPSALVVKIKNPAGTITTITENTPGAPTLPIVRVSAGVFKHNGIVLDAAGHWFVRFEGTGSATASEEHQATVDPSEFTAGAGIGTRALVGLAETKDWLNRQQINTAEDLDIVRVINDISERLHDEAGREFRPVGTNPQARLFDVDELAATLGVIPIGDLATTPTLVRIIADDWTTVTATVSSGDIICEPVNRPAWAPIRRLRIRPGTNTIRPGMRVEVTGTYGFPAVPGSLRQAALDAVASVLDRDVEHYRQDLSPSAGTGEGTNVIVFGGRPQLLTLPPVALAVAHGFRDTLVA